jgi:hypothetical protein
VYEIMRFCEHIPNSYRNKKWSPLIHIYSIKWLFLPLKHCRIPWAQGKKTLFPTLNVMILQMVRNEYVRFGGHVEVQVSYKILVGNTKKVLILYNLPCFQEGLFWGSFGLNAGSSVWGLIVSHDINFRFKYLINQWTS